MTVFLNGKFMPAAEAMVPVSDRGFMYGDGLFETTRIVKGRAFRLAQHLERMVRGADYLKIPLPYTPKEIQKTYIQVFLRLQTGSIICLIKMPFSLNIHRTLKLQAKNYNTRS